MGIHDRDYYRERSGFFESWGRQKATVWLIAITCAVFFAQCITGDPARSPLVTHGAYEPRAVLEGEVWRLFTPMFLHAGLFHLFFNMLILYWTGTRMEEMYGRGEFLAFYLIAGIFAQCFYLLSWMAGIAPATPSIGASGAVVALMVLYAFHFPRQQVLLFFVIPMPIWLLVVLYVILDTLGAFGARGQGIAYFVHLGGVLFGVLYYLTGLNFGKLFGPISGTRNRKSERIRLRVVPASSRNADTPTPNGAVVESSNRPTDNESGKPKTAPDEQLEKRVDQLLAKVSELGQESLTPEEREILFRASEIYKKRRK